MSNYNIKIEKTTKPRQRPNHDNLGFGKYYTDHMFVMNFKQGEGWYNPRIVPYGPISLEPSAACFHYAQEIFEGMKAYNTVDNKIVLFRPQENFKRLNDSCKRLVIPEMDEGLLLDSLMQLLRLDSDWMPSSPNTMYIRPFIIATEEVLGVKPSAEYMYIVILSPSGAYYKSGLNPIKIYVEQNYVRATKGGMGMVKTGGNYAASLIAQNEAHNEGYAQVLWLDGVERKYIEEVGAMNVFFVIDDEIVTPSLAGSILPGITRKSAIELLKAWGYKVSERKLSLEEVIKAGQDGRLSEAFGTGTAAVVSPIGELKCGENKILINDNKIGEISQKLYDSLTGMQFGTAPDTMNWMVNV